MDLFLSRLGWNTGVPHVFLFEISRVPLFWHSSTIRVDLFLSGWIIHSSQIIQILVQHPRKPWRWISNSWTKSHKHDKPKQSRQADSCNLNHTKIIQNLSQKNRSRLTNPLKNKTHKTSIASSTIFIEQQNNECSSINSVCYFFPWLAPKKSWKNPTLSNFNPMLVVFPRILFSGLRNNPYTWAPCKPINTQVPKKNLMVLPTNPLEPPSM